MAIIKQGILSGFIGNCGSLQGQMKHHSYIIKSRTLSANKVPTQAQINQRANFSALMSLSRGLKDFYFDWIRNSFDSSLTDINNYMKLNKNVFESGSFQTPENFIYGNGSIKSALTLGLWSYSLPSRFRISFTSEIDDNYDNSNDIAMFVCICRDNGFVWLSDGSQLRKTKYTYMYSMQDISNFSGLHYFFIFPLFVKYDYSDISCNWSVYKTLFRYF